MARVDRARTFMRTPSTRNENVVIRSDIILGQKATVQGGLKRVPLVQRAERQGCPRRRQLHVHPGVRLQRVEDPSPRPAS